MCLFRREGKKDYKGLVQDKQMIYLFRISTKISSCSENYMYFSGHELCVCNVVCIMALPRLIL